MSMTIRAGLLRHRVKVQGPGTPTRDTAGGDNFIFGSDVERWASIETLSVSEQVFSDRVGSYATHKIIMRYIADKNEIHRIVDLNTSLIYNVISHRNILEGNHVTEFICKRESV